MATPVSATLAGIFSGVVMPLLWPRLGDDSLLWILAFLGVIALPAHLFVVGVDATRGGMARDPGLARRVVMWLLGAVLAAVVVNLR